MPAKQPFFLGAVLIAAALLSSFKTAHALDDVTLVKTDQSYADVVFALENAIINRGFKVDYHGFIGDMLERTGSDVGSKKQVYENAEFFTFCSAVLSRKMMEEDSANIAYCPYVIFVYSDAAEPGKVSVGHRNLPAGGARDEINTILTEIVEEAGSGF
jgi:uncharacterized protein (DUF302 family)